MRRLFEQIVRFGIVGVIATIIDWTIFYLLFNFVSLWYILAKTIAFAISTLFNYILSMKYVFASKFSKEEKGKEFRIFFLLSCVGMVLTLTFLWFSVEVLLINPNISNILVAIVVMCCNFIMRKIWLEGNLNVFQDKYQMKK